MDFIRSTDVLLYSVAAVLIVYDLIVATTEAKGGGTISRRMKRAGERVAFIPYAFGILSGHFWGWNETPLLGQPLSFVVALALGLLILGIHNRALEKGLKPRRTLIAYLLTGVVLGVYLWPLS